MNIKIVTILCVIAIAGIVLFATLPGNTSIPADTQHIEGEMRPSTPTDTIPPADKQLPKQRTSFTSQKECEEKNGTTCMYQMCDYIPKGKTFEEVCGKDFQTGWVPQYSPNNNEL